MYATTQDFLIQYQNEEYSELSDIDNDSAEIADDRISSALNMAASEINQIIGVRYKLPLTVSVPFLKWANLVIARHSLDSNDGREKPLEDYEKVIDRLEKIANGKSVLVDSTGATISPIPDSIPDESGYYKGNMYSGRSRAKVPNFGYTVPERRRFLK